MVDLVKPLGPALVALVLPLLSASAAYAQAEQPLPALPPAPPAATAPAGTAPATSGATAPPAGAPTVAASSVDLPRPADTGCAGDRIRCHDGFYLRMALGLGGTALTGHGPSGSVSISGGSIPYRFAIGGTVGKGVVLGAALFGATTLLKPSTSGIQGAKASFGALSFVVDWFPSPEGGWHVGGDIGLGLVGLTQSIGGGADIALSAFGGYDWWFADQWSFGPMLAISGGSLAAINDSNNNDTGYRLRAGSIALLASFLYH